MYSAIVIDDEILVRAAIEKMVDWPAEGFILRGCYKNGREALDALRTQPVDLILTDIRMPVCTGLELMDAVRTLGQTPVVVILSAFDDFPLVKEAFKKGAMDYVLKQELNDEHLRGILRAVRSQLDNRVAAPGQSDGATATDVSGVLSEVIRHAARPSALPGLRAGYVLACLFVDDLYRELPRFGSDAASALIDPLTKLARQVPAFRDCDGFYSFDASRHFLFYSLALEGRSRDSAAAFVRTVKKAWKNYMNISCTVGLAYVDAPAPDKAFYPALEQAELNTTLRYVLGPGCVYDERVYDRFNPLSLASNRLRPALVQAVIDADGAVIAQEQAAIAQRIHALSLADARHLALEQLFILYYDIGFIDVQIAYKLGLEHQLYHRLHAMESQRDIEIFFVSTVRLIAEYIRESYSAPEKEPFLAVRKYIKDHHARSDLSLAEVSAQFGYNEKYFSTLFKKSFGVSYTDYLNGVRVAAAQELLAHTDMKIYAVARKVGYGSMEHFIRVFKKVTGQTPSACRKKE